MKKIFLVLGLLGCSNILFADKESAQDLIDYLEPISQVVFLGNKVDLSEGIKESRWDSWNHALDRVRNFILASGQKDLEIFVKKSGETGFKENLSIYGLSNKLNENIKKLVKLKNSNKIEALKQEAQKFNFQMSQDILAARNALHNIKVSMPQKEKEVLEYFFGYFADPEKGRPVNKQGLFYDILEKKLTRNFLKGISLAV